MPCARNPDKVLLYIQACYGHTEGAAGLTGMLTAISQVKEAQVPGIMCLRNLNSYVTAALSDWAKVSGNGPMASRETVPAVHSSPYVLSGSTEFCNLKLIRLSMLCTYCCI